MNKEDLMRVRMSHYRRLDQSFRPKRNAIELDIGNTLRHEITKLILVWLIRKGYPISEACRIFNVKARDTVIGIGNALKEDSMIGLSGWQVPEVITEARLEGGKRRADILVLDTGQIVEIETNRNVHKKDADETVYV